MVPFGGWEMPLSYPEGTIAEHLACRGDAVAFDVSHLGTVRVGGAGAFDRLQWALTNDLTKVGPGRAQYTHLLDPDDASVVDDIIVWWVGRDPAGSDPAGSDPAGGDPAGGDPAGSDRFDVMANASNTARVLDALDGDGVTARDVTAERAVIAVQGPAARRRLAEVAPAAAAVGRFRVTSFEWEGHGAVAAGTGYTGEDGVECAVPSAVAESFWEAVAATGVRPAGLGARDTLRLEAALPLHGHELGPGITPLQAGLGWVVAWDKPGGFRGREALDAERAAGPRRRLAGLATAGRQPPRAGYPVILDGSPLGEVTSGNFSPVLGHGIALALLPPGVEPGSEVSLDARGRPMAATVVSLPFVAKQKG
jgi:aminomethyltransferase